MQDSGAVKAALMSIPGACVTEHGAGALCMLGSLQHIAAASAGDILDATDLAPAQCVRAPPAMQHDDEGDGASGLTACLPLVLRSCHVPCGRALCCRQLSVRSLCRAQRIAEFFDD